MPETRYFTVTQTREVSVRANTTSDAILLAVCAFKHGQGPNGRLYEHLAPEGIWGNTISEIKELSLEAQLD